MRPPVDWKNSLKLPKTEFPMRADLARREPLWLNAGPRSTTKAPGRARGRPGPGLRLARRPPLPDWRDSLRHAAEQGPEGHHRPLALLMGKAARFVPGWDCHGFPSSIRWKGRSAPRPSRTPRFPQKCEAHARKFVDVMRADFRRLGCLGTWDEPYLTLPRLRGHHRARAGGLRRQGLLYRAKRPVHWCTTHQTALAEAEVEYADHSSPSIYVRFPRARTTGAGSNLRQAAAALVIWTTTPWTLAANLAIVANPQLSLRRHPGRARRPGREYLIVARELAEKFLAACGIPPPAKADLDRDRGRAAAPPAGAPL